MPTLMMVLMVRTNPLGASFFSVWQPGVQQLTLLVLNLPLNLHLPVEVGVEQGVGHHLLVGKEEQGALQVLGELEVQQEDHQEEQEVPEEHGEQEGELGQLSKCEAAEVLVLAGILVEQNMELVHLLKGDVYVKGSLVWKFESLLQSAAAVLAADHSAGPSCDLVVPCEGLVPVPAGIPWECDHLGHWEGPCHDLGHSVFGELSA